MRCLLIIFGGTGDLAHRKLFPAVYNLSVSSQLPAEFALVSVGRREKTTESFREEAAQAITKYTRENSGTAENLSNVLSRFFYFTLDFSDEVNYHQLKLFLTDLDEKFGTVGNRVFYLATAPANFLTVLNGIANSGMNLSKSGNWNRVVIEKPFGSDYLSAYRLNIKLQNMFGEQNIYRIDHYLGKEMLQKIMAIRFANSIFEPIWNRHYIDHVQITSSETVGVENRAGYYENAGATRDMMQNHMLQLLMLTAMDAPSKIDASSAREKKLKILKALRPISENLVLSQVVRGQYDEGILNGDRVASYRQETGVNFDSNTETYVAMKTCIDSERWDDVPFYLRTGKRLPYKTTEIAVVFKKAFVPEGLGATADLNANTLIIKVQPQEAVVMWLNGKKPGTLNEIIPIPMGFCQNCAKGQVSPDAYERLILDVLRGDATLFAGWDEVEYSWKFIDEIEKGWESKTVNFPNYAAGTWGPIAADDLLKRDGRQWNEYIWRCFNFEVIRCVNANT